MSKGLGLKREGEASFPFLCFWFLLSHHKRNILFSFPWKRCRFFPAFHSRGTMVLFLSAGKGYVALQVHQKCAPQIAPRSVGQSRIPGFAIAFVSCRLPVCSGMQVSSAFAECAKCPFADPLYVKVSTDFTPRERVSNP